MISTTKCTVCQTGCPVLSCWLSFIHLLEPSCGYWLSCLVYRGQWQFCTCETKLKIKKKNVMFVCLHNLDLITHVVFFWLTLMEHMQIMNIALLVKCVYAIRWYCGLKTRKCLYGKLSSRCHERVLSSYAEPTSLPSVQIVLVVFPHIWALRSLSQGLLGRAHPPVCHSDVPLSRGYI